MLQRILPVLVPATLSMVLGIPAAYAQSLPQQAAPARFVHHSQARPLVSASGFDSSAQAAAARQHAAANARNAYPQFNASLYPAPRPDIPYQVGGAVITNQALSPHEMLYAHNYQALYAPYYYSVKGGWFLTPFGIQSHEKWELLGTKVRVKYRSKFGLLSKFAPPIAR